MGQLLNKADLKTLIHIDVFCVIQIIACVIGIACVVFLVIKMRKDK
jgi:hypothetical protein